MRVRIAKGRPQALLIWVLRRVLTGEECTMNIFRNLLGQVTQKIPADVDLTSDSRARDIVMRLSKGNVRLQFGMYETEDDIAKRKASILEHSFI
jgi:hypothetical protein